MNAKKISVEEICIVGAFTALLCGLSLLTIPMPLGVPITLQTFGMQLVGIVLGSRRGMLSALLYVLIGAVGLPVFSGFTGGMGMLAGPTGGFILAFPIMAYMAGWGAEKGTVLWIVVGSLIGIAVDYTAGMAQFVLVTGNSLRSAWFACILPFLPTQALKSFLAVILGLRCRQALLKSGMGLK